MHGERERKEEEASTETQTEIKKRGDGIVTISKKTSFRAGLSLSH